MTQQHILLLTHQIKWMESCTVWPTVYGLVSQLILEIDYWPFGKISFQNVQEGKAQATGRATDKPMHSTSIQHLIWITEYINDCDLQVAERRHVLNPAANGHRACRLALVLHWVHIWEIIKQHNTLYMCIVYGTVLKLPTMLLWRMVPDWLECSTSNTESLSLRREGCCAGPWANHSYKLSTIDW